MNMPGISEIAIIAGVLLLIFGPRKLPELARGIGDAVNEFRSSMSGASKPDDAMGPGRQIEQGADEDEKAREKPLG